jgi:hypothetical protein
MQTLRHVSLAIALAALGASQSLMAQEVQMRTRRGGFIARDLKVVAASKVSIIADAAGNPLSLGSVDVSVTIVNESGDDWREATFNVNLFDASGALIRSLGRDYGLRITVPIQNAEEKTISFRNMAIFLPGGITELTVSRYGISVPEVVAQAQPIVSGSSIGFLAKDRRCAEEFLRASAIHSPEGREGFAELFQSTCGTAFESPIHGMVTRGDNGFIQVIIAEGKFFGESGWVPEAWAK